jgi:hypothetical protein
MINLPHKTAGIHNSSKILAVPHSEKYATSLKGI